MPSPRWVVTKAYLVLADVEVRADPDLDYHTADRADLELCDSNISFIMDICPEEDRVEISAQVSHLRMFAVGRMWINVAVCDYKRDSASDVDGGGSAREV